MGKTWRKALAFFVINFWIYKALYNNVKYKQFTFKDFKDWTDLGERK